MIRVISNEVSEESLHRSTSCFRDFRLRTKQFENIGHCLEIRRLDKIHTREISIDVSLRKGETRVVAENVAHLDGDLERNVADD